MRFTAILLFFILLRHYNITEALNCSRSSMCIKELEMLRIEEIKRNILAELGMTHPPTIEKSKMPSPKLREQFRKLTETESKDDESDKETLLIPSSDPSGGEDRSSLVAEFDVKEKLYKQSILEAKLSFYLRFHRNLSRTEHVQVQIYEKDTDGQLAGSVITAEVAVRGSQRVTLNLPIDYVERWYTSDPIQGLFVAAVFRGRNIAVHPQQTQEEDESMILQLTVSRKSRKRRTTTPVCTLDSPISGCCLYNLMIDFEKIGWDWIIAPTKYNAYMCRGDCKYNAHHFSISDTGHSKIMKAAMRMSDNTRRMLDTVGVCCHPTDYRYEYIRLIYVNRDGRVSVANVNGMIAKRCACS
ncbi:unnamed protein product [Caenorhabditis bovis]|uniref:TGF-beta family profile domain-containing protein n=1 Tax=Caenorhabditis bovis TaxID=2654633 RepID=A0A8S1ERJ9_9PELO|nr:unnamed protein product [Caenorhabditis bovis]